MKDNVCVHCKMTVIAADKSYCDRCLVSLAEGKCSHYPCEHDVPPQPVPAKSMVGEIPEGHGIPAIASAPAPTDLAERIAISLHKSRNTHYGECREICKQAIKHDTNIIRAVLSGGKKS